MIYKDIIFFIREKNQANTKKFIEERKNMGFRKAKVCMLIIGLSTFKGAVGFWFLI